MILWLPISLVLAYVGGFILWTTPDVLDDAQESLDEDTPQWAITFARNAITIFFSLVAAALLLTAYLLAKMALGL